MQARRIAIVFFIAFSFDYLYVCRRTTKRRIDIVDISAFLHFPAFVLSGRACFGIACSRLCATINTLQWIRQGQGDILGLAHRLRSIDSPFGYHIHLTSIPVYRTDFVRARCLFAGTLYLTDFSISYKFVFVNRYFKTFLPVFMFFTRRRIHERFCTYPRKIRKIHPKPIDKSTLSHYNNTSIIVTMAVV